MPERYAPSAAENYATSVLLSTLRAIKTAMARTPVDQWPWHSTSLAAIANCISILLAMHDIALWGEWVASKANIADIPTRTTMEDATAHPAILTWRPRIHECQSIPVQLIDEPILMIARSKLN
ncbi:hypothetical protein PPROV_000582700 [Pycnococcus provasolii]|uniref:Uncharacterized protein n=1 Tax=Pycnococcus provasolii TaxID=41880 RepID=A0A830HIY0_9CHLO|nr:hypothetical protein PPROV_000582700 [Pycnococcus provasolii]